MVRENLADPDRQGRENGCRRVHQHPGRGDCSRHPANRRKRVVGACTRRGTLTPSKEDAEMAQRWRFFSSFRLATQQPGPKPNRKHLGDDERANPTTGTQDRRGNVAGSSKKLGCHFLGRRQTAVGILRSKTSAVVKSQGVTPNTETWQSSSPLCLLVIKLVSVFSHLVSLSISIRFFTGTNFLNTR